MSDFVKEGIRLVLDGCEPALILHLMQTRKETLIRSLEVRLNVIRGGVASIAAGDNPRVVTQAMANLYTTDFAKQYRDQEGTVSQARARLREQPASAMDLDELTMFITDLGWIARRAHLSRTGGVSTLKQVMDAIDDEFLLTGLRLVTDPVNWQSLADQMAAHRDRASDAMEERYSLVVAGFVAIQEGKDAASLEEDLTAVLTPD